MSDEYYKISFCTTAMGRLDHVASTLIPNILNNQVYPNLEVVLLNYNSKDSLEEWIKENAGEYIEKGQLVYLREHYAEHFNAAHAKNVCSLASTGEVICNMDADNIAPEGYAFHVNELMHRHPRAFTYFARGPKGVKGRVAVFRNDYLTVRGYNEAMRGWGGDDIELFSRLEVSGCRKYFADVRFAQCILHSNQRRTVNMPPGFQNIKKTNAMGLRLRAENYERKLSKTNNHTKWGCATLKRNFCETIRVGQP